MNKIGLTGGIGSGKSVVSDIFRLMGVPVYNADTESKRIVDEDPEVRSGLIALFGTALYDAEGRLDRQLLAEQIFTNKQSLHQVNGIIHPAVSNDFLAWCNMQSASVAAIESAILFESGIDRFVNIKINVSAPADQCLTRVMHRDGLSRQQICNRMDNQMSDSQRNSLADYSILNDGIHALIPQVKHILNLLK